MSPSFKATAVVVATQMIEYWHGCIPPPDFVGDFNGFAFRPAKQYFEVAHPRCESRTNGVPYGDATEHGSPLLATSNMDFDPTFIPSGYTNEIFQPMSSPNKGHVSVGLCGKTDDGQTWRQEVVSVSQHWRSASGELSIGRSLDPPVISSLFTKERLEARTINGRPAVIINPRIPFDNVQLYMRDDHSFWIINAPGMSKDMMLRVAEGLISR